MDVEGQPGARFCTPAPLRLGDRVRLVSPASPPDPEDVTLACDTLSSWGLRVELGDNVFAKYGYLAGTDDQRLDDFNAALRDPGVRAIIATRGGKGSYRIADRLDFAAAQADPKFFVGISDTTILHLSLLRHCGQVGLHGALYRDEFGHIPETTGSSLRAALMGASCVVSTRDDEPTAALTTAGRVSGPVIGGNLALVCTAAGWALPNLDGAILFLEAIEQYLGQIDRQLTMLRKGGYLTGVAGVAVGQFEKCQPSKGITVVDLLRDHLSDLNVPILGGLPLGHGRAPLTVPLGAIAALDTATGTLSFDRRHRSNC
jgi:muramoyltetrapeptide carboxypeptidase